MWIARDREGTLSLFASKPVLSEDTNHWICEGCDIFPTYYSEEEGCMCSDNCTELIGDVYPEVTFGNSPKELILK